MMTDYTLWPPFDDPLPDPGPGGPDVPGGDKRAAADDATRAALHARLDAFHIAIGHAEQWAKAASKRVFVVRNGDHYHLADMAVLREYHRRDIYLRRADVVYMARAGY